MKLNRVQFLDTMNSRVHLKILDCLFRLIVGNSFCVNPPYLHIYAHQSTTIHLTLWFATIPYYCCGATPWPGYRLQASWKALLSASLPNNCGIFLNFIGSSWREEILLGVGYIIILYEETVEDPKNKRRHHHPHSWQGALHTVEGWLPHSTQHQIYLTMYCSCNNILNT